METNENAMSAFIIIVLFFFFLITLIPGGKSVRPDPDENTQMAFAKEMLRGNMTPEGIAQKEGYDLEHVRQWKDDYTQLAIKYALDSDKTNTRIKLLEEDIEWYKAVCRKYIGDDWEERTGFADHTVMKYKNT